MTLMRISADTFQASHVSGTACASNFSLTYKMIAYVF